MIIQDVGDSRTSKMLERDDCHGFLGTLTGSANEKPINACELERTTNQFTSGRLSQFQADDSLPHSFLPHHQEHSYLLTEALT
mgnify:FL=1